MVIGWVAMLLAGIVHQITHEPALAQRSGPEARCDRLHALGAMIERRWEDAPEWVEMLAAVLKGEGHEDGKGWWRPSEQRYGWTWLQSRFDGDGDGRIDARAIAPALRAVGASVDDVDRDLSGDITESDVAPRRDPPASGLTRAVFRELDEDSNDRVSWAELSWFFQRADRAKRGSITRADLDALLGAAVKEESVLEPAPSRERTLSLFLSGNLGSIRTGPHAGDIAPDFELRPRTGGPPFRLSTAAARRPVVLIFGSFT